ncbi:MAG: sulfate/molybdate ABC transporter ATP-binding protein [Bryobacteraceae bacterium]
MRQSSGRNQPELTFDARRRVDTFALNAAFRISQGALGLLGASGSGKSMTLRCIAGIETPDDGRIVLNDRVLFDSSANINVLPSDRRIGILFQDYALFPHLTVRGNITFGLNNLRHAEREARIADVVNLVRLEGLLDRYPAELSGGQRQRVALARALAIRPDALLLDEPFSALDPHLRGQLEEQLREALTQYEGVVLFVTHDLGEAFRFCQDLLVLDAGQVIASGPKHHLFEQPRTTRAARLTGCKNIDTVERLDEATVRVREWQCTLAIDSRDFKEVTHIGVRAHHLKLVDSSTEGVNVFPCWLMETSESPHEMTLYLHLQRPPKEIDTAHLQMEISKEEWPALKVKPQPWRVCLAPRRLLLLTD